MRAAGFYTAMIILGLGATQAPAAILSVDFNGARGADVGTTYAGNGVLRADGSVQNDSTIGTASGHWDGVTFSDPNTPTPSSGLLDSSSAATSVTISFNNFSFQDNCPGCNYAHGDPANMPLLNDYLGAQNPAGNALPTLTIGGLHADTPYDLYLYGTNGGAGAGATFSVNGSSTQGTSGGSTTSNFTTYFPGADYVHFAVSSDAGGNLVVIGTPGPAAGYYILNGFQLTLPAPEPSSVVLFGLGAVGLFAVARRRKV